MSQRCLGKRPVQHDSSIPPLRWLLEGATLAPLPTNLDWTGAVPSWPMLGNDTIGDCTIAAALHLVQLWTANAGQMELPDAACAIAGYAAATGYDPATGANDNGAVELDILKYWMTTGLPVSCQGALDRLDGFAVIDPQDIDGITRAIQLFGGVYAGAELPIQADSQFESGFPWSNLAGTPGSLGGHAFPLVGVQPYGPMCITWGRKQVMSWAWWRKYGSECYAPLRRSWIGAHGLSPSGLTMAQLDAKISALKGTLGLGALS